jgi:hypothetical protein
VTGGEWLLVSLVAGVVGALAGAFANAVVESFRRARAVIDEPDRDGVLDAVFPPTRAEGRDIP